MDEPSIADLIAEGRRLLQAADAVDAERAFHYWVNRVARWLDANAPNSGYSAAWSGLPTSPLVVGDQYYDNPEQWQAFRQSVEYRLRWLGGAIRSLQSVQQRAVNPERASSRRVFVVHGRNEAIRESVARLLERLDLDPVILHEQPNAGRTIIEKFIDYTDVAFAVVLLAGDDRGGLVSAHPNEYQLRPRQNAVFELGYFIGTLGRDRVCALYEDGVEIPSDYAGVLFIPLDPAGNWHWLLARELKNAGLPVDPNRIVSVPTERHAPLP